VDAMFEKFKDSQAIILDMRGYPQGTAWSIAPRLAEKPGVVAAQFRRNVVTSDLVEDSELTTMLFEQRIPTTDEPRYKGKTVMLIDERAIEPSGTQRAILSGGERNGLHRQSHAGSRRRYHVLHGPWRNPHRLQRARHPLAGWEAIAAGGTHPGY
jgi:hypothetical protein